MGKYVDVYLRDEEYETISKLAQMEKKKISTFVREKALQAVKAEMKDTIAVQKFIDVLERLPDVYSITSEVQKHININTIVVLTVINALGDLLFIERTKAEKLRQYISDIIAQMKGGENDE